MNDNGLNDNGLKAGDYIILTDPASQVRRQVSRVESDGTVWFWSDFLDKEIPVSNGQAWNLCPVTVKHKQFASQLRDMMEEGDSE